MYCWLKPFLFFNVSYTPDWALFDPFLCRILHVNITRTLLLLIQDAHTIYCYILTSACIASQLLESVEQVEWLLQSSCRESISDPSHVVDSVASVSVVASLPLVASHSLSSSHCGEWRCEVKPCLPGLEHWCRTHVSLTLEHGAVFDICKSSSGDSSLQPQPLPLPPWWGPAVKFPELWINLDDVNMDGEGCEKVCSFSYNICCAWWLLDYTS